MGLKVIAQSRLAALLHTDSTLLSLLLVGVSKQRIGFERMGNVFEEMLDHFANDLEADNHSVLHRDVKSFVSSNSAIITRELFDMIPCDDEQTFNSPGSEADHSLAPMDTRPVHEREEGHLQDLHSDLHTPQINEVTGLFDSHTEESDQDSVTEETGEDELLGGYLEQSGPIKHFILGSTAYQTFRRRLEDFVQPSLHSRLRDIVAMYTDATEESYGEVKRCNLRNLVTELRDVNPHELKFEYDQDSSQTVRSIGYYQHLIEHWTGERWDWWSLPRCPRPLGELEARLRWRCVCGENRWAEVPNWLAERIRSIISSLPMDTAASPNMQPLPEAHVRSSSSSRSSSSKGQVPNPIDTGKGKQPVDSSSNPAPHQTSGLGADSLFVDVFQYRVLFCAKYGAEYRLAQIHVAGLSSHAFFSNLKEEYFRLRSFTGLAQCLEILSL
ncbi:hypothetical protein DPV78_002231 [Talaromyces pinophilus]|nr:hypothetical protein DPV78_002231 [Talaromyces pinophilus]